MSEDSVAVLQERIKNMEKTVTELRHEMVATRKAVVFFLFALVALWIISNAVMAYVVSGSLQN